MNWEALPTGRRGRQPGYSDAAIQTCLTLRVLFGFALRQTTGFVESLLRLAGLAWSVPDFSTLSRRQKSLTVDIPYRGSEGPLRPPIDSTGIKVEGEGEWRTRKHGASKHRIWRKLHMAIDVGPKTTAESALRPSYKLVLSRPCFAWRRARPHQQHGTARAPCAPSPHAPTSAHCPRRRHTRPERASSRP